MEDKKADESSPTAPLNITKTKSKPVQSLPGGISTTSPNHSGTSTPSDPGFASPPKSISKSSSTLDDANEELSQLIISGKISSDDVRCLKSTLKEHVSLKEKVEKLKSLLGRSAKAQREAKLDSEASQKRLVQSLREIERLNQKLDKLQTRPSHMDLLMDFETNFDKALLSVGQSGGQETAPNADTKFASSTKNVATSSLEKVGVDALGGGVAPIVGFIFVC